MNTMPGLSEEEQQRLLRSGWSSHDARWYMHVAHEFGFAVANRLNRRVTRSVGQAEMRRLMKALGAPAPRGLSDAMTLFEAGRRLYVPTSMVSASIEAVDDRSYEVGVDKCFVYENITRAGIAEQYKCAVFDRIAGWHDAWELPLADELPDARCSMMAGQPCGRGFRLS